MIAILATVLDDAHPRATLLQGAPHVLEHRRWYIRVAHKVVRSAYQLIHREAADFDKLIVAVSDLALGIGGRYQALVCREGTFTLGNRLIIAHGDGPGGNAYASAQAQ